MSEYDWEYVRDNIDVEELLDALGIDYEIRDDELFAFCPHPDHDEDKPSWSINNNPDNPFYGIHNCLGCPYKGNAIGLWADVKGIGYEEAEAEIVALFEIENPDPDIIAEVKIAARFKRRKKKAAEKKIIETGEVGDLLKPLVKIREGDPFWRYIVERRRVTQEQLERFGAMGARPGTFSEKDKQARVVFPITLDERVMAYYGRAIIRCPPEYRVRISKGKGLSDKTLFGWDQRRGLDRCFIAEGIPDALAIESVTRGTSIEGDSFAVQTNQLFDAQRKLIRSYPVVILVPDGDGGGDRFVEEVKTKIGRESVLLVARLPEGKDPSKLLEDDEGDVLLECIKNAKRPSIISVKVHYNFQTPILRRKAKRRKKA